MTTFAGPRDAAGGSEDGPAGEARFERPIALSIDAAGNLYVTEAFKATIRRITPEGRVTTVAGRGTERGDDDGSASTARFRAPNATAVDRAGNLYVADTDNNTVRKITPAGVVTTIAGAPLQRGTEDGEARSARFYAPRGIAVDRAGNVYVADTGNHTIRKITADGVVKTFAGLAGSCGYAAGMGSAARFCDPGGLALDGDGNLYVADTGNDSVRKVTPGGLVTAVATQWSLDSPRGVAVDASGDVYVAVANDHTIRKITSSGVIVPVAGLQGTRGRANGRASDSRFSFPSDVVLDADGNVYVADTDNHAIRRITPDGLVTTLVGLLELAGMSDNVGNAARFDSPVGIASDRSGNIYVADSNNHTIRKITPQRIVTTLAGTAGAPGIVDGLGPGARFNAPRGVAVDGEGYVYVADSGNHTIRKISPAGIVTTLAGLAGSTGRQDGDASAARFAFPTGVAVDAAGNVYVADSSNFAVRKIAPSGSVRTLAGGRPGLADGLGTAAQFTDPRALTLDGAGNIYVADGFRVRKITSSGVVTTLQREDFFRPSAVAVDPTGELYVADFGTCTIRKIDATGVMSLYAGTYKQCGSVDGLTNLSSFNAPRGITIDARGHLFITDGDSHAVREIAPTLADVAGVDQTTGPVGATRILGSTPQTATSFEWSITRQPSGSSAFLSSDRSAHPTFTPDVNGLYEFRLVARSISGASISVVSFNATSADRRNRAVRH